jgi:hypothetical protein
VMARSRSPLASSSRAGPPRCSGEPPAVSERKTAPKHAAGTATR